MSQPTDFTDRIAIVTGGASGIGRALGRALRRAGAHVVLADLDGDGAAAEAGRIDADARASDGPGGGHGSVVGVALDVRDRAAVEALVDATIAEHGRLDLLCNNAGVSMGGETHLMPAAYWDRTLEVNLGGVVNGVLAAYPRMVEQGHGHIVNTASGAGLVGAPLTVAYATTKHAVVGLSTTLRPEAAVHGVRVSVLCPGAVDTPILDSTPADDLPPPAASTLSGREFLARLGVPLADADRVAAVALRGIARNRSIILAPRSAGTLWYVQRLSPALVGWITQQMARRVIAGLPSTDGSRPDRSTTDRSATPDRAAAARTPADGTAPGH